MSQIPDHLKYLASHEWANLEPAGLVSVGITDHAQEQLGDVVFVELPDVGIKVSAGQEVAVVESVKAASDIYAPVSGTVVEVNDALGTAPELVNQSPYEQGWFFRIEPSDLTELDGLLDADGYADVIEG